jgi:hypothetical protein
MSKKASALYKGMPLKLADIVVGDTLGESDVHLQKPRARALCATPPPLPSSADAHNPLCIFQTEPQVFLACTSMDPIHPRRGSLPLQLAPVVTADIPE